jgi:hypothetical protein
MGEKNGVQCSTLIRGLHVSRAIKCLMAPYFFASIGVTSSVTATSLVFNLIQFNSLSVPTATASHRREPPLRNPSRRSLYNSLMAPYFFTSIDVTSRVTRHQGIIFIIQFISLFVSTATASYRQGPPLRTPSRSLHYNRLTSLS